MRMGNGPMETKYSAEYDNTMKEDRRRGEDEGRREYNLAERGEPHAGLLEPASGAARPSEGLSGSSDILAESGGTLDEPDGGEE